MRLRLGSRSATIPNPMDNSTNLLPPERRRLLTRDFVLRTVVVVVVMVTLLTLAAGVLLIPTYVLLEGNANAKKERLASMEASLSSSDEAALSARLLALSNNAAKLATLSSAPSASATIREALAISRPGITLSSFAYTPAAGAAAATLVISGVSATRDALRNYQLTLQGAPFARAATLPVSAYANDTNINFAITVTLAL
jgi:hypothetical protein